ncbi:hypothetical protein [Kribbella soli]|uniref:Uncharacterized protein n=1 Tax=Kribbella soli TaxID=1124743 RepID=A0A4R0HJM3_9ACTN|nr:hypothetical protein [Kribbella soli]TCC10683.1 hypothetical protein E0H45_05050 [Kribbella soli]
MVNVAVSKVLPELGKASWTAAQLFAYEIALEGVRQSVGYYAQQLAAAEAADVPDADVIDALRAEQAAWAARGQDLDVLDVKAVAGIRKDADELLSVDEDEDDG